MLAISRGYKMTTSCKICEEWKRIYKAKSAECDGLRSKLARVLATMEAMNETVRLSERKISHDMPEFMETLFGGLKK
jgi:hypothetical protein